MYYSVVNQRKTTKDGKRIKGKLVKKLVLINHNQLKFPNDKTVAHEKKDSKGNSLNTLKTGS